MGFHARADARSKQLSALIDMRAISLYATITCWDAALKCRSTETRFNGLFVHTRDMYELLSGRRRAGVFTGVDSENTESEHQ